VFARSAAVVTNEATTTPSCFPNSTRARGHYINRENVRALKSYGPGIEKGRRNNVNWIFDWLCRGLVVSYRFVVIAVDSDEIFVF